MHNAPCDNQRVPPLSLSLLRSRREKQEGVVAREEELGRLLVELGPGRTVPLSRLRTSYRPVIFSGSKGFVRGVLRAAEPYKRDLQKRGVLLVPVDEDEEVEAKPSAKGFAKKNVVAPGMARN